MTMDLPHSALAIAAAPTDAFEQYVKQVVDGEKDWPTARGGDPADVEAERRRLARELFDGLERVDLVGHSTPTSCCLRLGDWVLTPDAAARLASYLPKSVQVVRLIGCRTASTDEGRAAAMAFTRYGLEAYGTLNRVYATHFDHDGVKRGAAGPPLLGFFPEGRGPDGGPPVAGREAGWFRRLAWGLAWLALTLTCGIYWLCHRWLVVRRLPERGAPRERIAELLRAEREPMPELLTDPLLTFEVTSGSGAWTLEILFDFECARFYPSASATAAERDLVYAIRGSGGITKTPLEAYLERAPRGVAVVQRHEEAGARCGRVPARGAGAVATGAAAGTPGG